MCQAPAPDSGSQEEAGGGQEDGGPEAGGEEVGGERHEHREGEDPPQVEQHQRAVSPVEGLHRKHCTWRLELETNAI